MKQNSALKKRVALIYLVILDLFYEEQSIQLRLSCVLQ